MVIIYYNMIWKNERKNHSKLYIHRASYYNGFCTNLWYILWSRPNDHINARHTRFSSTISVFSLLAGKNMRKKKPIWKKKNAYIRGEDGGGGWQHYSFRYRSRTINSDRAPRSARG